MGVIEAVGALRAALIGRVVELPAELLVRFPELGRPRYRRGGLPPLLGGWALGMRSAAAVTLGRTVFLAHDARFDPALLLHELRHVQQFGETPLFPLLYLWESLRRGYMRNRFEIDARRYADARVTTPGSSHLIQDV